MKPFNKTLLAGVVAAAFATPMAVMAQAKAPASPHTFTGNVGLFSQYIFRGLTQTDGKPALQGGFDYSHASGFYAGLWGSNVSWLTDSAAYNGGSYSVEIDTYLGFKMPVGDFTFDVGFLRYNYPGRVPPTGLAAGTAKADTNEVYAAVTWKFATLKYSYSLGDTFGVDNARGSDFLDLTATLPLGSSGFNLIGHVGRQTYEGPNSANAAYSTYRVGLAKEFMGLNFSLNYTDTNAKSAFYNNRFGRNIGDSAWTVGVQKTF
ncbi:MAG: TorF family putative porin [Burkholderiales bacterium]|nr:TorF family putative porin [Burkholderiales bacterium]